MDYTFTLKETIEIIENLNYRAQTKLIKSFRKDQKEEIITQLILKGDAYHITLLGKNPKKEILELTVKKDYNQLVRCFNDGSINLTDDILLKLINQNWKLIGTFGHKNENIKQHCSKQFYSSKYKEFQPYYYLDLIKNKSINYPTLEQQFKLIDYSVENNHYLTAYMLRKAGFENKAVQKLRTLKMVKNVIC